MFTGQGDTSRDLRPGEFQVLLAPREEGGTVYQVPNDLLDELRRLEQDFLPRVGCRLFFEDEARGLLTPFAVRLFRKGYVSSEPSPLDEEALLVTAIQPELEARLHRILDDLAVDGEDEARGDDVVIPEADLPYDGTLGAMPALVRGDNRRPLIGVRPGDHPVDILENILYGRTGKDDPESSHHGEHEISDGVDRD
ncbi:MAG: hypothetical protein MUF27_02730 [Acidobacteria bacterium]|jgi:hypothetical protein|nr:hypothetical protein [Acidobacteriota bacterium]